MTVCIILITRSLVLRFWFDWWFRWTAKRSIFKDISILHTCAELKLSNRRFETEFFYARLDGKNSVFFHNKINWTCLIKTKTIFFYFSQNERTLRNNHFSMKFFSFQKSKQPNRKCENMKIWITACESEWKFYIVIRRIVAMPIIIIFALVRISKKIQNNRILFFEVFHIFFVLLSTNSI